jgi:DNA-binding IclR family transcriptional regulator
VSIPRNTSSKRDAFGKALQVLWYITNLDGDALDKEWGVRELGSALHLTPASVYRILTMLTGHGLVHRNPKSGQYQIGTEYFRLALKLTSHFGVRNVGIPVMRELVAQCNETSFLGLYDPFRMEVMFVAAVNSNHPLRYVVQLNEWFPVYAGASGLAIMAYLSGDERKAIIERTGLVPITRNTITDAVALEEELERVRARGYAVSVGHRNLGAVAIAAPIRGHEGEVIGDLALSIPEPRFDPSKESELADIVVHHAKRISEKLKGVRA